MISKTEKFFIWNQFHSHVYGQINNCLMVAILNKQGLNPINANIDQDQKVT